jgi:hypothetical protein
MGIHVYVHTTKSTNSYVVTCTVTSDGSFYRIVVFKGVKGEKERTIIFLHRKTHIVIITTDNFPFLCGYISLPPANGVYISQLIRSTRACYVYENFLKQDQTLAKYM